MEIKTRVVASVTYRQQLRGIEHFFQAFLWRKFAGVAAKV